MRPSSPASSRPSMPGIEMSRNTASGATPWISRSAVRASSAASTDATPGASRSSSHISSSAGATSSTTSTRRPGSVTAPPRPARSRRHHPRVEPRYAHDHPRARTGRRLDDQPVPGAEHRTQPTVDVDQPEAAATPTGEHVAGVLGSHARPVVLHRDHAVLALGLAADLHRPTALGPLDAVLHGVLHQ